MVSGHRSAQAPTATDPQALCLWVESLPQRFTPSELAQIREAGELAAPLYAQHHAINRQPLLQHALGTASILYDMNMDADSLTACILYAVPDLLDDWSVHLSTRFNQSVVNLIDGISRMSHIQALSEMDGLHHADPKADHKHSDRAQQLEALRKMLLAMVQDIRVVLIKLAERTQLLRHLSGASPAQQVQIARENQNIYAPLANRLGVWQLKWELEDLSLRYLEPQLYKEVAKMLDERRVDREQYIAEVVSQLQHELTQAGIQGEVSGRPKHIYSIVKKMKSKHLQFNQLYDVRAVRIMVQDVKDCYTALGLVHHLWQPIPGEFDDYIARPKSNNYRSLHTAVSGPRGLALEVQIRTFEMHQHSELGVAAHWRYKEGGKSDAKFDEKIAWLRQILSWKDEVADQGDLLEQFNNELFQDKVYVLTPQGKVIDLPAGATPIDFAYALHTDLGHRTRGAKIDGHIVPLHTKLENGQRVEILTAKHGAPSRDWLNPSLGFLQSASARAKVRHWFKYQHFEENVAQGRAKLDKELHRAGASSLPLEKVAQKLQFHKLEDCLAAIGRGDISEHQIAITIQGELAPVTPDNAPAMIKRPSASQVNHAGIMIEGIGNVQTTMAKCCKPVSPEPIVAYLTRQHSVTIHRQACSFITRLDSARHNRLLNAQWGNKQSGVYEVDIVLEANDRQGLLRDISELFAREKINTTKANTLSRNHVALMHFTVELVDLDQLAHLLGRLKQVPGVITAQRQT
ncbi:bifunctional (p)ppGpp synthetase/guanosine-3',5'-bis(diphosphate) 3'-pyrophosphohydrolase [Methylophilus sp.]|uniref:RelA/SpoT family protein n=1 Tax=Methylophilus sp. TaxID=29541 RepID=UPI000D49B562|nr:bifunctional (p)ppGpp synthetase/guanosine-3',5'-bis(diphosphate) 3'-pyrophosphohydrolase [Methylophilus sp.]PPD12745.1 MAG: GTP pyrophosphokinase [Methylophilus sp.]